jgi:signal transduction histidine kinase
MANVHLMRVSAITAANKDFFYYRNNALNNMKRIEMDEDMMTERDERYWRLALSEFHIVSSEYYYSLRQESEANDEIRMLEGSGESMIADSVQMARFILLKSVNDIFVGDDESNSKFRNVVRAYRIGREKNALYLCAKSLQMLAIELSRTDSLAEYRIENIKGLLDKRDVANDTLALALSMEALNMSKSYGSRYMESFSYLSISDYYFYKEDYVKSLDYAEKALRLINEYHSGSEGCDRELYMYSEVVDSISTEMVWINDPEIVVLPGWIAEVRERLSMIYSALGDKAGADYNRNIYLDILDATRQDMRMQQRLDSLAEEERALDWALAVCGIVILLIVLLLIVVVRRQKRNNLLQRQRLLKVIDDCKEFLALSLKKNNSELTAVEQRPAEVNDKELKPVIDVFTDWVEHNKCISGGLYDLQRKIESENYLFEKRIEEKKRDNISKLICMSVINGIAPFMDRAIKEVEKLKSKITNNQDVDSQKDLHYLSELINKINDYNDVVSRLVMMRQGTVKLNVENFALQPMFEIIGKNRNLFEAKGLTLKIDDTSLVVKADAALTFFMINTLMDNARKYTEKGGRIKLGAEETEDGGVKIFIEDTGRGLSEQDVNTIVNEKVYDASNIGSPDDNEELKNNKGFGFGLMSCKGIIDKYRKTSPIFSVCRFAVVSELGKGSTFSFTLPKGVLRSLEMLVLIMTLPFTLLSCISDEGVGSEGICLMDNDTVVSDTMLQKASYYADQAYYSNVQGNYADALLYVDSAISTLNQFHTKSNITSRMMELVEFINSESPAKYDLIKIAIAHHRFVWIHPFENGNGRVVRLFTYALLLKFVFKSKDRIINPTAVFCSDRSEYYKHLSLADNNPEEGMVAWAEYRLQGLKMEIEKMDKLLDYRYLHPIILKPALKDALDRKYITDKEYKILIKLIDQPHGFIQSSDIAPIFPEKTSSDRSRMIKSLVDKRMLRPINENARRYLLSFENNYLLRSILTQLDKNGFLPERYK